MALRYATLAVVFCVLTNSTLFAEDKSSAADAELLKAVKTLDEAFTKQDKDTIRKMTDRRHMSISPSYQFF